MVLEPAQRPMVSGRIVNLLVLGPPGSGKGTQAKRIAQEYRLAHISTGDMFRSGVAAPPFASEVEAILARGELVPDNLTLAVIRERLTQEDARHGFVLDGFPRNLAQAEALDRLLEELGRPLSIVLELQIPDALCVERLLKRAEAEGRTDDTPDVIARRLEIYHRETEPLIRHYRAKGTRVVGIHAERSVDEVWSEIQQALEQADAA